MRRETMIDLSPDMRRLIAESRDEEKQLNEISLQHAELQKQSIYNANATYIPADVCAELGDRIPNSYVKWCKDVIKQALKKYKKERGYFTCVYFAWKGKLSGAGLDIRALNKTGLNGKPIKVLEFGYTQVDKPGKDSLCKADEWCDGKKHGGAYAGCEGFFSDLKHKAKWKIDDIDDVVVKGFHYYYNAQLSIREDKPDKWGGRTLCIEIQFDPNGGNEAGKADETRIANLRQTCRLNTDAQAVDKAMQLMNK